ncbi:helix-turn-helix transcriptional regulator [Thermopolyspora sp. NPDC052614]|uniref:helix-turn-helix domain-containing protein n=1 Tax=Thermopolyspora sp. NPDC052614 TaxID=3155682 RepID=UPI0034455BF7
MRDLRDSYPERVGESLTIAQLAARSGYSVSMIGAIERGENLPDGGDRVRALDDALCASGQLIGLWPLVQRLGRHRVDDLIAAVESGNTYVASQRQEDDMERRLLFRLAGLGLLTGGPAGAGAEPLRQQIEQLLGATETYSDEHWQAVCQNYDHAVHAQPPTEVRDNLILDLSILKRSLAVSDAERVRELQRTTAWLAALHANVLTRLGDFGGAQRWWVTARHAADESGDLDMRVLVRAKEALFGLYAPRTPESMISVALAAQELAKGRLSTGLLIAVATEAQALAVLGRAREAQGRLAQLEDLSGRFGQRPNLGWTDDAAWFTASWVHSHAGAMDAAEAAREEARKRSPFYQNSANLRLHEAITLAREGGHEEALGLATEIISGLPRTYRTQMILHTGRQVENVIPLDRRKGSAYADYRAAMAGTLV